MPFPYSRQRRNCDASRNFIDCNPQKARRRKSRQQGTVHSCTAQKSKGTFLYRAPKLILEPLNYTAIRKQYMDIFSLDIDAAGELASLTKGYPFAFQVLGYLYWENRDKKTLEQILPEYDQYLDEYVYSKIWSELSDLDKKIVTEMSLSGETQVKALRERLDMKSELFSVYRERLKRKGVIISKEYGKVTLALPRFDEFVKIQQLM